MNGGVPWSKDEDQRLRDLALSGLGTADIAFQMKRSVSAVRKNAERLNIAIATSRKGMTTVRRLVELGLRVKKG